MSLTERMSLAAARPARALVGVILATVLALTATACGDSGSDDDAAPGATTPAGTDAFPVTINQADGDVTIENEPRRVVALDFPSADAAIALGVVPVGMAEISYLDAGLFQWTSDALNGATPEMFPVGDGYPFETIARLDPDVILAVGNAFPFDQRQLGEAEPDRARGRATQRPGPGHLAARAHPSRPGPRPRRPPPPSLSSRSRARSPGPARPTPSSPARRCRSSTSPRACCT